MTGITGRGWRVEGNRIKMGPLIQININNIQGTSVLKQNKCWYKDHESCYGPWVDNVSSISDLLTYLLTCRQTIQDP